MYTTVKELHIAVDIGLQGINSNRRQLIQPEEMDVVLNESVLEFIETRSSDKTNIKREGAEESQKRYDDLRELKRVSPIQTIYSYDYRSVYSFLPKDYLKYLTSYSSVSYNCNGLTYSGSSASTLQYWTIPFHDATISADTGYYKNFIINITGASIAVLISAYTEMVNATTGLRSADAKFSIINLVLEHYNKSSEFSIYWQRYGNVYKLNSFIIVANSITITGCGLSYKYSATPELTYTASGVSSTIAVTSLSLPNVAASNFENELVASHNVYGMLSNYYLSKNRQVKPLATLENRMIRVYFDNTFIIRNLLIEYYKKPILINYRTNTMCELTKMEEIVAIAIRRFKARLSSPDYPTITKDLQIIE